MAMCLAFDLFSLICLQFHLHLIKTQHPSISLIYCKVTVWLLTFNIIYFMAAFSAVFTFAGSGPALTAHERP
jgi:hypothetical protein